MTIAFISNFINHHQVDLADELYRITDGNYTFIEMIPMPDSFSQSGYPDYSTRPYVLQAWRDENSLKKVHQIIEHVDVLLVGYHKALKYEIQRCNKEDKITFEVSERALKKGLLNLLSPNLLKWLFFYHTLFYKKRIYKLCCSAYASSDLKLLRAFNNKCYKWGYFTKINDLDIEEIFSKRQNNYISLMWCARFIDWKHPELPIKLAARLKKEGYKFTIDMYGNGPMLNEMLNMAKNMNVSDVVNFCGNVPNKNILKAMQKNHIFLLTSDRNEGWGAVANEALGNGCVLVGSDKVGSVPFLLKNRVNGCVFKSGDLNSLFNSVKWLLDNPSEHINLAANGYYTMRDIWSPKNAAQSLVGLINDINNGNESTILNGPCSKDIPI